FCAPFISYAPDAHRSLPSFPTRRSSDLEGITRAYATSAFARIRQIRVRAWIFLARVGFSGTYLRGDADLLGAAAGLLPCHRAARSEEHTSELQSRENLVCRLLLEKKK